MNGELTGLNDVFHIDIPKPEISNCKIDVHGLGFSSAQERLRKALELLVRHDDAGYHVLDINLHNLRTVTRRVVGYVYRDGDGVAGICGGLRECDGRVYERAVRFTIAELFRG